MNAVDWLTDKNLLSTYGMGGIEGHLHDSIINAI